MSIVRDGNFYRLRLGHRGGSGGEFASGVILANDIPADAQVIARVDRPTSLPESTDVQVNGRGQPVPASPVTPPVGQPYVFEHAPRPVVTPVAGSASFRSLIRTLSVLPGQAGVMQVAQVEPAWAAFAPAVSGSKVPEGVNSHFFPVGQDKAAIIAGLGSPDGARPAGELVRIRWTGTQEVAATVDAGGNAGFTFQLLDVSGTGLAASNIAPGSVAIAPTIGGNLFAVRDTGNGRLVGQDVVSGATADGTINYFTGVVTLEFSTATDAVAILSTYEHTCLYLPLDIHMEWDALLAQ